MAPREPRMTSLRDLRDVQVEAPTGNQVLSFNSTTKKWSSMGTSRAHIANLSNTATGTEIATAVNAIILALEGFGITASS